MTWEGVPVILAVNNLHHYLKRSSVLKMKYASENEKRKCIDDENNRIAFMNRVNAIEVNYNFIGGEYIPYDEQDLAHYFLDLWDKHDIENF